MCRSWMSLNYFYDMSLVRAERTPNSSYHPWYTTRAPLIQNIPIPDAFAHWLALLGHTVYYCWRDWSTHKGHVPWTELRVDLSTASGQLLIFGQAEREGDLKPPRVSCSRWVPELWWSWFSMVTHIPSHLLTQPGQIHILQGHCPSAVGWQWAGLASHVNSQALVCLFVQLKKDCCETLKQFNPCVFGCSYHALGLCQAVERTIRGAESLLSWSLSSRLFSSPPLGPVDEGRIPTPGPWGWLNTWCLTMHRCSWQQFISHVYPQNGEGGHCTPRRATWGLQFGTEWTTRGCGKQAL